MPTDKEIRAWLEQQKIHEPFGGPRWRENTKLSYWMKRSNEEDEQNNEIIDAILSALSGPRATEWTPDRPCPKEGAALSGPSEAIKEERERCAWIALTLTPSGFDITDEQWIAVRAMREQASALILGRAAREESKEPRPVIVCLCGSSKFKDAFEKANLEQSFAGKIVLSMGGFPHADGGVVWERVYGPENLKPMLDALHLCKIDLADEVFILNVGGYIGESTGKEIEYARKLGKKIIYLEPIAAREGEKEAEDGKGKD